MKKLLIAAAVLATASTGSAFADDSQSTGVKFAGTVADTCVMTTPVLDAQSLNATAPTLGGANTGSSVLITSLSDSATGALVPTVFALSYADSYCNYAHTVSIQAKNGGMLNLTSDNAPVSGSGAFVQRVGYSAQVMWAGSVTAGPAPATSTATAQGDSSQTTVFSKAVTGAYRGDLILSVMLDTLSTDPVVAGTYHEGLTLKIGATL